MINYFFFFGAGLLLFSFSGLLLFSFFLDFEALGSSSPCSACNAPSLAASNSFNCRSFSRYCCRIDCLASCSLARYSSLSIYTFADLTQCMIIFEVFKNINGNYGWYRKVKPRMADRQFS